MLALAIITPCWPLAFSMRQTRVNAYSLVMILTSMCVSLPPTVPFFRQCHVNDPNGRNLLPDTILAGPIDSSRLCIAPLLMQVIPGARFLSDTILADTIDYDELRTGARCEGHPSRNH